MTLIRSCPLLHVWTVGCDVLVSRAGKTVFVNLVLKVLVYNVEPKRGLLLYSFDSHKMVPFRPSKPLREQMHLNTLALVYAVAKWYWKRDEALHAKKGR